MIRNLKTVFVYSEKAFEKLIKFRLHITVSIYWIHILIRPDNGTNVSSYRPLQLVNQIQITAWSPNKQLIKESPHGAKPFSIFLFQNRFPSVWPIWWIHFYKSMILCKLKAMVPTYWILILRSLYHLLPSFFSWFFVLS